MAQAGARRQSREKQRNDRGDGNEKRKPRQQAPKFQPLATVTAAPSTTIAESPRTEVQLKIYNVTKVPSGLDEALPKQHTGQYTSSGQELLPFKKGNITLAGLLEQLVSAGFIYTHGRFQPDGAKETFVVSIFLEKDGPKPLKLINTALRELIEKATIYKMGVTGYGKNGNGRHDTIRAFCGERRDGPKLSLIMKEKTWILK